LEGNVTGDVPLRLSEKVREKILALTERYPRKSGALLPALWEVQKEVGWIPDSLAEEVAEILEIPPSQVFEVLSFYVLFHRKQVGKYTIWLCRNISCYLRGYEEIKACLEKELGIREGETTEDGLFTFLTNECLGACEGAPMMQINDRYYMNLTPEKVRDLIQKVRKGEPL
jgi:NADH-quinone oxidoreductase E subunit